MLGPFRTSAGQPGYREAAQPGQRYPRPDISSGAARSPQGSASVPHPDDIRRADGSAGAPTPHRNWDRRRAAYGSRNRHRTCTRSSRCEPRGIEPADRGRTTRNWDAVRVRALASPVRGRRPYTKRRPPMTASLLSFPAKVLSRAEASGRAAAAPGASEWPARPAGRSPTPSPDRRPCHGLEPDRPAAPRPRSRGRAPSR